MLHKFAMILRENFDYSYKYSSRNLYFRPYANKGPKTEAWELELLSSIQQHVTDRNPCWLWRSLPTGMSLISRSSKGRIAQVIQCGDC